jgi:tRNA(Ile)-lysidine synthase
MTQSAFTRTVSQNLNVYILHVKEFDLEDIVIKKSIIREMLWKLMEGLKDLDAVHVELILDLCEKDTGKIINLPGGVIAERGYDIVKLYLNHNNLEKMEKNSLIEQALIAPGTNIVSECNIILHTKLIKYKKNMIIPQNGCTKWFDYDKIKNTVLIRPRKSGDFIQFNNQGNTKKLKQFFIDEKIPKETRDSLPLITDGSHVMWIPGHRMSEAYKVEEETKLILEISLDGGIYNE